VLVVGMDLAGSKPENNTLWSIYQNVVINLGGHGELRPLASRKSTNHQVPLERSLSGSSLEASPA